MLSIPDSITATGYGYVFRSLRGLNKLCMPDSTTDFGTAAVTGCAGLIKFTIPENVTNITSQMQLFGLRELHVKPTSPPTLGASLADCVSSDCVVYVPSSSLDTYKGASNWSTCASQMQGE